jgi:hypothetical protein
MTTSGSSGLKTALYTFCYPYVQENPFIFTQGSSGNYTQDIKAIITQGELQCLLLSYSTDANYDAAKEQFMGSELSYLNLAVEGNNAYTFNSAREYNVKSFIKNKQTSGIPGPDQTASDIGNQYMISISPNYAWDFFNPGAPGINFNQSNMLLTAYLANDTWKLHAVAIYKGVIHIYDNKSAELKYDMSSPF